MKNFTKLCHFYDAAGAAFYTLTGVFLLINIILGLVFAAGGAPWHCLFIMPIVGIINYIFFSIGFRTAQKHNLETYIKNGPKDKKMYNYFIKSNDIKNISYLIKIINDYKIAKKYSFELFGKKYEICEEYSPCYGYSYDISTAEKEINLHQNMTKKIFKNIKKRYNKNIFQNDSDTLKSLIAEEKAYREKEYIELAKEISKMKLKKQYLEKQRKQEETIDNKDNFVYN